MNITSLQYHRTPVHRNLTQKFDLRTTQVCSTGWVSQAGDILDFCSRIMQYFELCHENGHNAPYIKQGGLNRLTLEPPTPQPPLGPP